MSSRVSRGRPHPTPSSSPSFHFASQPPAVLPLREVPPRASEQLPSERAVPIACRVSRGCPHPTPSSSLSLHFAS